MSFSDLHLGPSGESSQKQAQQVKYLVAGVLTLAGLGALWPLLGRNLADLTFLPHEFCYRGNITLIGGLDAAS